MLANWFFKDLLDPLGLFGLAAQAMFMLRFVVQWFASERRQRSYVPVAFWYFSLAGGLMTFLYAFLRQEPVFMLAQGLGITIYTRNLILIYRRRLRYRQRRVLNEQPATANKALDDVAAVDAVKS
jgi:lipid-A-disaccharide synthase-like uncharacterized protein